MFRSVPSSGEAGGATSSRRATVSRLIVAISSSLAVTAATLALAAPALADPGVTFSAPAIDGDNGWYRGLPTIGVTAADSVAGIASVTYGFGGPASTKTYPSPYPPSVSISAQPATPGAQTLSASARNGTNATSSATLPLKWDPDPPSQPTNPRFTDALGGTKSRSGTNICAAWAASSDTASGLRNYRVQLAESPDFGQPVADRATGSTATSLCMGPSDGVTAGHSYYFRAAARDQAGNIGTWSAPSNRIDVSDQVTGPGVAHAPVSTAYVNADIPVALSASCGEGHACDARLLYRPTPVTGSAAVLADGWTRVDMSRGSATSLDGQSAVNWNATVPGTAVTTTGVDYFLEAADNNAITRFPGSSSVNLPSVNGPSAVAHSYLHVAVVSPPLVAHDPPPFGESGHDLALTVKASCPRANCTATLYYRTTTDAATAQPLLATPAWPRVTMAADGAPTALGGQGQLLGFRASIPAGYVDTRGVDYLFSVTDGSTTAWWPGTAYQGYYAPTDGMRTGYHHTRVLEPSYITHAAVTSSPYRQPVPIEAQINCSVPACAATLYFRTTTTNALDPAPAFATVPMTTSVLGASGSQSVVALHGEIPAAAADTRGVDYFFSVTDGATTSWWPGTTAVDGYVPVPGTQVGYAHVRILDPPHFAHVPVASAPALADLTIEAQLTCATEACQAGLHYATSVPGAAFVSVSMGQVGSPTTTPAGKLFTYRAVVPAAAVTTAGLAYYLEASDGYTRTFSPGTSYWGSYVPSTALG